MNFTLVKGTSAVTNFPEGFYLKVKYAFSLIAGGLGVALDDI